MDEVQEQHERATGDVFISELNQKQGKQYKFYQRGNQAPDLIYRDGNSEISLEISTCYYDSNDAKARWQIARNRPDAPKGWESTDGTDFEKNLIMNINTDIENKCAKDYGQNCFLIVYITPPIITFEDMKDLLPSIKAPSKYHFAGIYLMGHFGVTNNSLISLAIWKLAPNSNHTLFATRPWNSHRNK